MDNGELNDEPSTLSEHARKSKKNIDHHGNSIPCLRSRALVVLDGVYSEGEEEIKLAIKHSYHFTRVHEGLTCLTLDIT